VEGQSERGRRTQMILRELGETRPTFLHTTVYADFLYADFFPKRQNGCARSKPNKNLKTENDMRGNDHGELLRIYGCPGIVMTIVGP